jgi:hypothetical protein
MNATIENLTPDPTAGEGFGKPLVQQRGRLDGFGLLLWLMLLLVLGLTGCGTTPSQTDQSFPLIAPSGMAQPN